MTERGASPPESAPACPFVAFEDDREARADLPDHRHRCFAEADPAPRALAHQEAYCLSSAFPVCPTFQAWARREAALARPEPAAPKPSSPADGGAATGPGAGATRGATAGELAAEEWGAAPEDAPVPPIESTPRRNPPRDWAAPPPWATGAAAGAAGGDRSTSDAPRAPLPRREGQGLAGSAADRLASGGSIVDEPDVAAGAARIAATPGARRSADLPSAGPDPELAGLVGGDGGAEAAGAAAASRSRQPAYPPTRAGRRPAVSSTRSTPKPRDTGRLPEHEHVQHHDGPEWEQARRYEAYPTIRSRPSFGSLAGLPRVALLAGALVLAAVGLFFLPALLGIGGDEEPSATPSPSAVVATPTPEPTPEPEPTQQTYTIQQGDTLSKIAREFGLTLDQLLEANADTISDPDRISVGDVIIIPVPPSDEVDGGGASEAPAP